jgi:Protein of unknown function (DUF3443)
MRDIRIFVSLMAGLSCAFLVACGGGSSSTATPNTIASTGSNVVPIAVNGGPTGEYVDAAFASVTVCVPGTSTCQTVDDVLVDTGSFGLRILSSALTQVSLPQQKASDGNAVAECLTFLDSYTWGPVQTADVQIAGEKASSVPIQVLSDTDFTAPSSCTSSGFQSADTLESLGANGILGVGLAAQDCRSPCLASYDQYYECPSSGCVSTGNETLAQQVVNPVAMFAADNNGVIVELPAVSAGGEPSVTGSLVFGIGTQSNNGLGSATVYSAPEGSFTTIYNGQSYPGSFIDSGSNGYFFLDSSLTGLANCGSEAAGFYCPSSTTNFTAANVTPSGTVKFSIANAETLFANTSNFALGNLGGVSSNSPPYFFDWGLPFFFGRNVFVAINGRSTPSGTGPYWAY